MNRPLLRPSIDPTPRELGFFSLWLVVVVLSMAAMVLIPPFNLVFWPIIWIYDLATARPLPNSLELPMEARLKPAGLAASLWDREIDG